MRTTSPALRSIVCVVSHTHVSPGCKRGIPHAQAQGRTASIWSRRAASIKRALGLIEPRSGIRVSIHCGDASRCSTAWSVLDWVLVSATFFVGEHYNQDVRRR